MSIEKVETVLIIGAGQAGASAILELRAQHYQGKIILIGDEQHLPYERPPLSKDAILTPEQCKLEILSAEKLLELGVVHLAGQAVVKIEPDVHQVHLHNGDVIGYDKLLLATGGSARRLPDLDALNQQVYTLRTLEDAQALIQVLQPNRRIILIGGGVIGLELASSARAKDCQVTLLEVGSRLMGRTTPAILADYLLTQHCQHGIDVRLNTQIKQCQLEGDELVLQLSNSRGDVEVLRADAIIYGIGIVPNSQLAVAAGLAVDGMSAIQVDANCQTSVADIYAAGDVATQLRCDGQYRRVETWENANLQAAIFARHVMGVAHPQANPAWFWSDQLGTNYQFVGDMGADEWYIRGEMDHSVQNPSFILFGVSNQIIVAGITVNAAKEMRHVKKMVAGHSQFSTELHLDPTQQLRKMV